MGFFWWNQSCFFLERAGITNDHPVRDTYIEPECFLTLTEKILNHHELTVANELIRTSLLYEVIALLVDSQHKNVDSKKEEEIYDYSPDIYVNSALEYIREHYYHIRVTDIASYIGISSFTLVFPRSRNLWNS